MCFKKSFKTYDEAVLFIISIRKWGRLAPYQCNKCTWVHNTSSSSQVRSFMKKYAKVGKYIKLMGGSMDVFVDPPENEHLTVISGFVSACSWGDVIYEGEEIRADGEGGWEHVECGDAEEPVVNDDSVEDPEFSDIVCAPEWSN